MYFKSKWFCVLSAVAYFYAEKAISALVVSFQLSEGMDKEKVSGVATEWINIGSLGLLSS